jgi:fermentation-respiration switch protein FrsA (DUF1100 family)
MIERVTFAIGADTLVGDLHLPDAGRGPGVIVSGSWTTVRQQMAGLYARRLAARGFAALAFDFRGWGESGGGPRHAEAPARKAEDLAAAAAWLAASPRVAPGGVHALAICASAGYAARAAIHGAPLRSLALVAPWLHDRPLLETVYGGPAGVAQRLERAAAARRRWETAGELDEVPAVSTTDEAAAMFGRFEYYLDAARGAIPEWDNRFAVLSWSDWLGFDGVALAPRVPAPTFVVHGDQAAIPDGARRFLAGLAPAARGGAAWLDGTQFDFYDQDPQVDASVDHAIRHFERNAP